MCVCVCVCVCCVCVCVCVCVCECVCVCVCVLGGDWGRGGGAFVCSEKQLDRAAVFSTCVICTGMWASDGHHRTYRNMGFISAVIVTGGCWHN